MSKLPAGPMTEVRVDLWLWAARFFKTRSLAKQAIDGGKIDVNGGGCKPAKALHAGDRLKISRGEERLEVEVLALSDKRSQASVAQTLYAETEDSKVKRQVEQERRKTYREPAAALHGRPTKRDRRIIDKLSGGD